MTTRVVQWATGPVGGAALQGIIDSPDLELAGVYVFSPSKVGVDAGALVGRPPTGVHATDDRAAILALDAEVVVHAASKAHPFSGPNRTNTDDIVALLESGKSVITITSYSHLPTYGADVHARIVSACSRGGSRFHAAGEHPGFMFERLATTVTGLSGRVDRITVQEFVDCRAISERQMLVDLMGMGRPPEELSVDSRLFRGLSSQYEQSLAATADVLGLTIDEIRPSIQTATSDRDVEVACGVLPAGTVVGQIMSWTAYRQGVGVLVAEEYWTATGDIAEWDRSLDSQSLVRVIVEGYPSLRVELRFDNEPVEGLPGVVSGQAAVAMTAIRAIPDVLKSPPGVVLPAVFGAYQWPAISTSCD
jgi:2,4-diaminopentanoate dehydrogenase